MHIALLVFPDFLLLALGLFLRHKLGFGADFFKGVERLVYYVLFPALLLRAVLAQPIDLISAANLMQATLGVIAIGTALAWSARWFLRPDPMQFASTVQCGFRFNTYIGLALAVSLGGADGLTTMALIVGFSVPVVNLLAVYALAQHAGGKVLGALLRNPLFMSTVAGLALNLAGVQLPGPLDAFFNRLGAAGLALGIICVGASLSFQASHGAEKLVGWMVAVKLLALPLAALAVGALPVLGLTLLERQMLLLFASLPTASSAYVLAAGMGGDARLVSLVISLGTTASVLTIPVWMQLI